MRFKTIKLDPFSYGPFVRDGLSIKEVAIEAFRRGIVCTRPTVLINLSETGGYTDFIRTVSPLVLNERFNRTVSFTLTKLVKYDDGSYNISNLIFKYCDVAISVSRDKISSTCLKALKCLLSEHKIPLILDTDDDLFAIPKTHPGYASYKKRLPRYIELISMADIISASTKYVLDGLRTHIRQDQKAIVIPNFIDTRIWNLSSACFAQTDHNNTIRALYFGTETHDADLSLVSHCIGKAASILQESYGITLTLTVIGGTRLPLENMTVIEVPEDKRAYPLFAAWIQSIHQDTPFDFGIAPLDLSNPINRSKSNLKFLEYSALGIPGIYTDIEPYKDTIVDMQNGILIKANDSTDWCNAVVNYSTDDNLRLNIARCARDELIDHLLLQDNFEIWQAILEA